MTASFASLSGTGDRTQPGYGLAPGLEVCPHIETAWKQHLNRYIFCWFFNHTIRDVAYNLSCIFGQAGDFVNSSFFQAFKQVKNLLCFSLHQLPITPALDIKT